MMYKRQGVHVHCASAQYVIIEKQYRRHFFHNNQPETKPFGRDRGHTENLLNVTFTLYIK